MTDFSFDKRVADRYNAQRAHPPEVSQRIGEAIAAQVTDEDAPVLEIGVGTGRIALPVANAGRRVVGIDLSHNMLGEVIGGDEPHPRLLLLQADMHALPFPARTFAAVTAVHVLHLARDWQQVLREVVRVMRPGGAFLQGDDWIDPQSVVGNLRNTLREIVIELAPDMLPPAAGISKQDYLRDLGGTDVTETVVAEWTTWVSPLDRLQAVENRLDAESWILPDALFDKVVQRLYQHAESLWPKLEEKQPVTRRFLLKITRGAWRGTL